MIEYVVFLAQDVHGMWDARAIRSFMRVVKKFNRNRFSEYTASTFHIVEKKLLLTKASLMRFSHI
jgi:hypothetical protein